MSTFTPNYNLEKPEASDAFGNFRASYNQNMDIIDQNLGGGGGSSTLAGLSDVDLQNLADGQVLTYDANSGLWINANGGGGGGGAVQLVSTVIFEATGATAYNVDYALSQPIDDFDFISIYNGVWSEWDGAGQKWGEDSFIPVHTLNLMYSLNKQYAITSYATRYLHLTLHGSTLRVIAGSSLDVCKIVGHKLIGGGGVNYSDVEQKIGTWTENGVTVDLYQKTINYQCLDNANFQDAFEITNEDIKEMVYEFKISSGDIVIDRWVQQDFWETCVGVSTITGNLAIMVKRYTNYSGWKAPLFICTIKYTKSN